MFVCVCVCVCVCSAACLMTVSCCFDFIDHSEVICYYSPELNGTQ